MNSRKLVLASSIALAINTSNLGHASIEMQAEQDWLKAQHPELFEQSVEAFYVRYGKGKKSELKGTLNSIGAKVTHELDDYDTVAITLPKGKSYAVKNLPMVEFMEPVPVHRPMAQVVPWNVDQFQARDVWDVDRDGNIDAGAPDGSGVKFCIIDTGFYATHDDFLGITHTGTSQITGEAYTEDENGHGTHVAGTANAVNNNIGVVGVMPGGAELHIVKIFDNSGVWVNGQSNLGNAAIDCRDNGANAISMSLGGGFSATEEAIFHDLYDNFNIVNIAAAGNDGNATASYPASYDSVISVAALRESDNVADFSQYPATALNPVSPPTQNPDDPGDVIDFYPWDVVELSGGGEGVLSTWPGPPGGTNGEVPVYRVTNDGTDYSAIHIEESGLGDVTQNLVDGGECNTPTDDPAGWSGNVVLCQRGTIAFADKMNNVADNGGLAVVLYNNTAGTIAATCGGGCTSGAGIPGVSITQAEGQFLQTNGLGLPTRVLADDGSGCAGCVGGYNTISGTSMATPGVAAGIAWAWDSCGGPSGITNKDLRKLLRDSARDLSGTHDASGTSYGAGWDPHTGFGLVQLADALDLGNLRFGSTCSIGVNPSPREVNVCTIAPADDAVFSISLDPDYNGTSNMTFSGHPVGSTGSYSVNPVNTSITRDSDFTVTNLDGLATGSHTITLTATDSVDTDNVSSSDVTLNTFATVPNSFSLTTPINTATGVSLFPTLTWAAATDAQTYNLEVATDLAFSSIVITENGIAGTSHSLSSSLSANTNYYWRVTAVNPCGNQVSSVFSFTTANIVTVSECSTPALGLTDGGSISDTFSFTQDLSITDIDVRIDASHSYIGDLSFTVTNVGTGTATTVIDRPGEPASTFGCGNNNIDTELDDEAGIAVEGICNGTSPAIDAGPYLPNNSLSVFDGESSLGNWQLTITDAVTPDSGTLNEWCLDITGTPPIPTYTVGGTVSGLTGSGLVLQNNGGDNLAIAADGSFTFSTSLADSSLYNVSVLTQPTSPSQTCSVTDESGTITGANVTNVTVTCSLDPDITFSGTNLTQDVCVDPGPTAITPVTLTTTAIGGYSNTINLAFNPALPTGISGGFSANDFVPAAAPGTDSTLNLSVDNTASQGVNSITIEASGSGVSTKSVDLDLNVILALTDPTLSIPVDGSTEVATSTSFTWTAVSGASSYDIDIATDPLFSSIVFSSTEATNSYTPGASLSDETIYYWRVRANNSCGSTDYVIASFETAPASTTTTYLDCSSPALSITDNSAAGVTDTITIANSGTITDVNITLDVSHTQVGDLIFNVENDSTATNVTVIDRPGYTGTGNGCNRDNINTTLDDAAGTPVEGVCPNADPTIGAGPFSPNNPLSAFNTEELAGTWTLTASDNRASNTGTINEWCVESTVTSTPAVTPADYSDLNSSYGVAKHEGGGAYRLGTNWNADSAYTEDNDNTDDDGIAASGLWTFGSSTANLNVNSNLDAYVACWFDWNNDGTFAAGEKSIGQSISAGGVDISVTIPAGTTFGQNGDDFLETRCRLYNAEPTRGVEEATGTAPSGEVEDYKLSGITLTPITLAYNKAFSSDDRFQIDWTTTSEAGVIGFNLYGLKENSWVKLNESNIEATGKNSLQPNSYSISTGITGFDKYKLVELKSDGNTQVYGPFSTEQTYGKPPLLEAIDWEGIRGQSLSMLKSRQNQIKGAFDHIKVHVDTLGLHRITYEQLLAAGVNWNGVASSEIALTFENLAVPRKVSDEVFAPGSYIDFIGEPADSLYTDVNIYELKLNSAFVKDVVSNTSSTVVNSSAYHMAKMSVNADLKYTFASPADSPWYNQTFLVYTTPKSWSFPLDTPNLIDNGVASELTYSVWGGTDWSNIAPDHHLTVSLDNNEVSNQYFDGTKLHEQTLSLSHSQLQNSSELKFNMPADTGAAYEMVLMDQFSINYPASLTAMNDRLQVLPRLADSAGTDTIFESGFETVAVEGFEASGFSTDDLYAYAYNGNDLTEFPQAEINLVDSSFTVVLPHLNGSTYHVGSNTNTLTPVLELGVQTNINLSQPFDYLIISHPDFIGGLTPLINHHQSNGLNVLTVNVEDIYAQYSHHRKEAQAIQSFILNAYNSTTLQAVLLVGADSYDYKDHLGIGSLSFVPTLYHQTDSLVTYAPVDSLFADIDSDLVPDIAIGRLPVRTLTELQNSIDKIFAYVNKSYTNTAVFATDRDASFDMYSNNMQNQLAPGWSADSAYINSMELNGAQQLLIDSINQGVSLTNFFGHSGPSTWSFEHLLDNNDVLNLNNDGKPTFINQYGCWNNYFVMPTFNTMSHNFMSMENKGAVAVMGSSTLSESFHEGQFGVILTPKLTTPGVTVGRAVLESKQQLAKDYPDFYDIYLGWTLMGDPMISLAD